MTYKKQIDIDTYVYLSKFGSQKGLDFEHMGHRYSGSITFGAAINIEKDLGKKFNQLITLECENLDHESIESVIYHGLNSGENKYSLKTIRNLIASLGYQSASFIAICLITIFLYPKSSSKIMELCNEK